MKKLLLSIALGLSALAVTPEASKAGTFGLFTCGGCGCSSCCFCVRPYNAFTPVCSGNITCMGCMPFCCPTPGYNGMMVQPGYGADSSCQGGACEGGETVINNGGTTVNECQKAQGLPPLPQMPQLSQPNPFTNPLQPLPANAPNPASRAPTASGAIQANYYQGYAPAYNPYLYYTYSPMGQMPYYWNGK
jgi:hypothetical protein